MLEDKDAINRMMLSFLFTLFRWEEGKWVAENNKAMLIFQCFLHNYVHNYVHN